MLDGHTGLTIDAFEQMVFHGQREIARIRARQVMALRVLDAVQVNLTAAR